MACSACAGITRLWDDQHHLADLNGGLILALMIGTPFFMRAISCHDAWAAALEARGQAAVGAAPGGAAAAEPAGQVDVEAGHRLGASPLAAAHAGWAHARPPLLPRM
jgi:hypothetical protein